VLQLPDVRPPIGADAHRGGIALFLLEDFPYYYRKHWWIRV